MNGHSQRQPTTADIQCLTAVQRSYSEMRDSGAPESVAFETALAVLHWHHPEITAAAGATLLHGWLHADDATRH